MTQLQRQSRLIIVGLWMVMIFLLAPCYGTFGVFLLPLVREFHCGRAQISQLAFASALTAGILSPLAGWLLERVEAKWMFAAGAMFAAAGYLLASRAHSLDLMIAAYAIVGVGIAAGTLIPTTVVAANWFAQSRGLALGATMGGMSVGLFFAPIIIGHLLLHHNWRLAMTAMAMPMLVVVVPAVILWIRSFPPDAARPVRVGATEPGVKLAAAIRTRSFWLILVLHSCFSLAWYLMFVHAVPILVGNGFSESTAATLFGIQALFSLIGFIGNGLLADRIGARATMMLALGIWCLALIALHHANPHGSGMLWAGAYLLLFPFAGPIGNTITPLIAADALGMRSFGSLVGVLHLLASVAGALGPVIAGHIFDVNGNYLRALYLSATLAVLGILATWRVTPVPGRDLVWEDNAPRERALAGGH